MDDREYFYDFFDNVAGKVVPGVRIKFKKSSIIMRLLAIILFPINRRFLSAYTTVLGKTVYFPNPDWLNKHYRRAVGIISHELVHLSDRANEKPLMFEIKYLFPQILSVLSLLALFAFASAWFLLALVFLVFLAPWPAPYRLRYESTGYCMSMHYREITGSSFDFVYWRNIYAKELSGSSYYYPTMKQWVAARELTNRYDWSAKNHPACIASIAWLEAKHTKG